VWLGTHPEAVRKRNKEGNLPLHLALRQAAPAEVILAVLRPYPEAARENDSELQDRTWLPLIDRETWLPSIDRSQTALPLHVALQSGVFLGSTAILGVLEAYPEAARKKHRGVLPLHRALGVDCNFLCDSKSRPLSVVLALLRAYPEACGVNHAGMPLLQLVLERGALPEVVLALLEYPQVISETRTSQTLVRALVRVAVTFAKRGDITGLSRIVFCTGGNTLAKFIPAVHAALHTHPMRFGDVESVDVCRVLRAWLRGRRRFLERNLSKAIQISIAVKITSFVYEHETDVAKTEHPDPAVISDISAAIIAETMWAQLVEKRSRGRHN